MGDLMLLAILALPGAVVAGMYLLLATGALKAPHP